MTSTEQSGSVPARRFHLPARVSLAWRRLRWWQEVLIIGLGYGVYEIIQGAAPVHGSNAAFTNSHDVARLEARLHIDPEHAVNHFANARPALASLAGYYYDSMHYLITPGVLIWLWWRRPAVYARWRSALVTASMAALLVFWLWPVAPPRLALKGIVDTLVARHIMGTVASSGSGTLVNQYAAMPSLHVGWAFWCAAAVVSTTTVWWRHAAWLYPLATTWAVLASGNHYLLDGAAGVAFILLGLAFTRMAPERQLLRSETSVKGEDQTSRPDLEAAKD